MKGHLGPGLGASQTQSFRAPPHETRISHPPRKLTQPQCFQLGVHLLSVVNSAISHVIELNLQPIPSQELGQHRVAQRARPLFTGGPFLRDQPSF